MKKLMMGFVFVVFAFPVFSQDQLVSKECKPKIDTVTLDYKPSNNKRITFAGMAFYPSEPKEIVLYDEGLIFIYDKNKSLTFSNMSRSWADEKGKDFDVVEMYKQAFAINKLTEAHKNDVEAVIKQQRLCDNQLVSYQINNTRYDIIRTKKQNYFNTNSIDVFMLGDKGELYMLFFKGFSSQEIDDFFASARVTIK